MNKTSFKDHIVMAKHHESVARGKFLDAVEDYETSGQAVKDFPLGWN